MKSQTTIHDWLRRLDHRVDDVALEFGYVLKAIEELSVEKGMFTRTEIQNKIIELNDSGWTPESATSKED